MEKVFEVKNLSYQVGSTKILKNITVDIEKGKYITVVGPSGSGKSTFMRILASMISATSGEVLFNGKKIETYDPIEYRQKVSYAFQQPTLFGKTVKDNLIFPFEVRKQDFDEQKVLDYLKMVNLSSDYLEKNVNDVSGGEKQRIALLRNLIFPPEVLITDEVTAGLDAENKRIVHKMLEEFNQRGLTILRVTHDETEIDAATDKLRIKDGEIANDYLTVSNSTLALGFVLVLVALVIGYIEKLHIDKDIIIGVVRAIVQLSVVGYVLKFVIKANDNWLTLACFIIIVINASWNAGKRGNGIPKAFQSSLLAIFVGTTITLTTLVLTGSIKFVPEQIVPVTGMIASNVMVAIGLCYRNMKQTFTDRHQQVLEKLALGADIKLASLDILRDSIKSGMQPTIDSIKTLGLVSLPGMMSGLIFAGVDPVKAIKYQIMVTFMLLASTSIGSIISCYLGYKQFFNDRKQLNNELIS